MNHHIQKHIPVITSKLRGSVMPDMAVTDNEIYTYATRDILHRQAILSRLRRFLSPVYKPSDLIIVRACLHSNNLMQVYFRPLLNRDEILLLKLQLYEKYYQVTICNHR